MFKKSISVFCFALLLVGCSTGSKEVSTGPEVHERNFIGGYIRILIEDGQLQKITSSASSPVVGNATNSKTDAAKVAEAKARVQIEKMRETFIESTETIESRTTTQDTDSDGQLSVLSDTAREIVTRTVQRIDAVQRGVYVVSETYDSTSNTVTVIVETDSSVNRLLTQ